MPIFVSAIQNLTINHGRYVLVILYEKLKATWHVCSKLQLLSGPVPLNGAHTLAKRTRDEVEFHAEFDKTNSTMMSSLMSSLTKQTRQSCRV